MKLSVLVILAFVSCISVFATLPITDCNILKDKVSKSCGEFKLKSNCDNLKFCHELRNHCPQPKDSVTGCTDFAGCIEEKATAENTSYFCSYKWTGQPNDGTCYLKNQRTDLFSYRCPGFNNRFDSYTDSSFTCEGHRMRAVSDLQKCNMAIDDLKTNCPAQNSGVAASLLSCSETGYSIQASDSIIAPVTSHDGPRNNGVARPKEEITSNTGSTTGSSTVR